MVVPATLFENSASTTSAPSTGTTSVADPHAGEHQAPCKGPRSSCTWSPRRARATSWPRPTPWPTTARASSTRPSAWSNRPRRPSNDLHPGLRPVAVRHGRARPRLVGITPAMREAPAWWSLKALPGAGTTTSASPSSMRDLRRRLACEGLKPWWRSTPPSCSAAMTSSSTTWPCRTCRGVRAGPRAGLVGATAPPAGRLRHPTCCVPNMAVACPPTSVNAAPC